MPKPDMMGFYLRGFPLEDTLQILKRWDILSEPDRALATWARWHRLSLGDRCRLNPYYESFESGVPARFPPH